MYTEHAGVQGVRRAANAHHATRLKDSVKVVKQYIYDPFGITHTSARNLVPTHPQS
jgi:hypothetical protein